MKDDLKFVEEAVPEPGPGQALVRTCYVSVDPTSRVWMSDYRSYMPPSALYEVMRSIGVGQAVESRRDDLPKGTLVLMRLRLGPPRLVAGLVDDVAVV